MTRSPFTEDRSEPQPADSRSRRDETPKEVV